VVADAKEAARIFADDARGNGGGHFQRRGEAEAPVDVIANHLELRGGAASEGWRAARVHRARAGDDEIAFPQNDF
jgi:hypothetical protein